MPALRLNLVAGYDIRPDAGLSLVEVLIAMFIMALASSFILLSLPERGSTMDALQAQISQDVKSVADQAIVSGTPHGLRLTNSGYEIVQQRGADWQVLPRGQRDLPDRSKIQKVTAGRTAAGKNLIVVRADRTGVVEGSTLRLSNGADQRRLTIEPNASLTEEGGR